MSAAISAVVSVFASSNITISDFIFHILTSTSGTERFLRDNLLLYADALSEGLIKHPKRTHSNLQWATEYVKSKYAGEIRDLVQRNSGWHFSASTATADQLQEFRIEEMAERMQQIAPQLWDLVGLLLSAVKPIKSDLSGDSEMSGPDEEEEEYLWQQVGDLDLGEIVEFLEEESRSTREKRLAKRRQAIITVVSTD